MDAWVTHWKRLWCLLNNINFQSLLFTKSLYTKRPIPCVSQTFHFNTFKALHFSSPVHGCQPYGTPDSFQALWYKLHSISDWVKNGQSMKIFIKSKMCCLSSANNEVMKKIPFYWNASKNPTPWAIRAHKASFLRYDCLLRKKNNGTLNVVIRHLNSLCNLNELQLGMFEAVLDAFWNKWHWTLHVQLQVHSFLCLAWLLRSLYSKLFPIWSLITKVIMNLTEIWGIKRFPFYRITVAFDLRIFSKCSCSADC